MSLSAADEQTSDAELICGTQSTLQVQPRRAEVIRRQPTGDSGSWQRSPCRPQHESDGIQVSFATLPAALTSVSDLCRARPARWPDHLLVIEQRSFACVQVKHIAKWAGLHQICVRCIAARPD